MNQYVFFSILLSKFWNWICRKGVAAINMQATVDDKARLMEYSFRPGSSSDKIVWSKSSLRQNIHSVSPTTHLLGDAVFAISEQLMITYPIKDDISESKTRYNHLHSRTRIIKAPIGSGSGRFG